MLRQHLRVRQAANMNADNLIGSAFDLLSFSLILFLELDFECNPGTCSLPSR
jgi:hypothetical protein